MFGYMGGGEILRATLDDAALDRKYAIYNAFLNASTNPVQNANTMRGTFQCRSDRWFLMTGVFPFWTRQTASRDYQTLAGAEFIEFADGANRRRIVNDNVLRLQIGLMNENLNARVTLPEYCLWAPNALIDISWQGRTDLPTNGVDFKCLCFEGIEYRF